MFRRVNPPCLGSGKDPFLVGTAHPRYGKESLMAEEKPKTTSRSIIILTIVIVLIIILLIRCRDQEDTPPPEVRTDDESEVTEIQKHDYSGALRVVSTDGLYIHEVLVKNAEGEVVAKGDTGNPFPVPEGDWTVHAQGHVFPVTVEPDQTLMVRVQEEVGLGKLSMPAPSDHPYPFIVPIVVTDLEGNEVARGRSGSAIDLPPGKYIATQEDRVVEVEIRTGETTRIDP